jgi:lipoprotein-anchoring transpeptidase ErfK/SrfK
MTRNVLLQQAYDALKAGRKVEARRLLEQVVAEYPHEFRGWLWLASVTDSPQTALAHIERAAALNPGHPSVGQARTWAEKRLAAEQPVAPAATPATTPAPEPTVEREKRPFPFLLWGGAAALILILLLVGIWFVGGNGRTTTTPATASNPAREQPAAPLTVASVDDEAAGGAIDTANTLPDPTMTPAAQPTRSLIQAKSVAAAGDPLPTWTATPLPTATPTATPTPEPTFVANQDYIQRPAGVRADERWIDINLTTQTLTAYEGDTPVFSTLISSGISTRRTVTGQFRVWHRNLSQTMDGRRLGYDYYLENVPYVMYFYRDFAIHGTYWHNNFGTPMSSGCVNMKTDEAEWLYNWSQLGTLVNVRY